ncbi:hypothetical protein HDV01_004285, partial [Terramyces sp. JEL0728]
ALQAIGGANNGQQTVDQFLSTLKGGSNQQNVPTATKENALPAGAKTVTVTQTVCAPTATANPLQAAQTVTVTQTVCAATPTANPLAGNGNNKGNKGDSGNGGNLSSGNSQSNNNGNNAGSGNNNASVIAQLKTIVQQMANLLSKS